MHGFGCMKACVPYLAQYDDAKAKDCQPSGEGGVI